MRLALAVAALATGSFANADMAIMIQGLSGQYQVAWAKGGLPVNDMAWSMGMPLAPAPQHGGEYGSISSERPAGQPTAEPLRVTLPWDAADFANVFQSFQMGRDLGAATLLCWTAIGGGPPVVQTLLALTHARISRVDVGVTANRPTMTLYLTYAEVIFAKTTGGQTGGQTAPTGAAAPGTTPNQRVVPYTGARPVGAPIGQPPISSYPPPPPPHP